MLLLLWLFLYFISQWICTIIWNNLVRQTLTGLCFSWNFMAYNLHIWAMSKTCPWYLHICSLFVFVKIVAVVGGMAPQKQQRLLRKCPEIIVATPGRLWDLISEVSTFRHKFSICWALLGQTLHYDSPMYATCFKVLVGRKIEVLQWWRSVHCKHKK